MTGTKTSVWLGEDLAARWKASGLSLTELVRRGVAASETARPGTLTEDTIAAVAQAVVKLLIERGLEAGPGPGLPTGNT
jgi:hypothetical protein